MVSKILQDLETWSGHSAEQQEGVARDVTTELGGEWELSGLDTHTESTLRIATLRWRDKLDFRLIPGGTAKLGLSEQEAVLRAARADYVASLPEGTSEFPSEYQWFLDAIPSMRPVYRVTIGPLLVSALPVHEYSRTPLSRLFADEESWEAFLDTRTEGLRRPDATVEAAVRDHSPFRLTSEAEWEYLSRAGTDPELGVTSQRPHRRAQVNAFGLLQLGQYLEVCSDVYAPNHDDTPRDGTARSGEGTRVVRGGAGQTSGQVGGAWTLYCHASRSTAFEWRDHAMGARLVLDVP